MNIDETKHLKIKILSHLLQLKVVSFKLKYYLPVHLNYFACYMLLQNITVHCSVQCRVGRF
jgi:hypothetical protein